jgi:predicted RNA-binding Zn ribbon-like protein
MADTIPFIGGRIALNFVGTLGKRSTDKLERIRTPDDLARWVELAGLGSISPDAADLKAARVLREALYRLTIATLDRGPLRRADVKLVNEWAARQTPAPALAPSRTPTRATSRTPTRATSRTPTRATSRTSAQATSRGPATVTGRVSALGPAPLRRRDPQPTASEVLAAIARDAINLLSGPDARSIRECEDPACTLLFVDTSRSHRRRWCSMNSCGARSKMRTLRAAN